MVYVEVVGLSRGHASWSANDCRLSDTGGTIGGSSIEGTWGCGDNRGDIEAREAGGEAGGEVGGGEEGRGEEG